MLKENIGVALKQIKIPEYGELLTDAIVNQINKDKDEQAKRAVEKYKKIVNGFYQKRCKLSEFARALIDAVMLDRIDSWYTRPDMLLGGITIERTHEAEKDERGRAKGEPSFIRIILHEGEYGKYSDGIDVQIFNKGRSYDYSTKEVGDIYDCELYKTSPGIEREYGKKFTELNNLELFLLHVKTRGIEITELDFDDIPDGFYCSDYGPGGDRIDKLKIEWPGRECLCPTEVFDSDYLDSGDYDY